MGRVSNPEDIFRYILQRNKTRILKALNSLSATGLLVNNLQRDGHEQATYQLLNGSLDEQFIQAVDQSTEIGNFIRAPKYPTSKTIGTPVEELDYKINAES